MGPVPHPLCPMPANRRYESRAYAEAPPLGAEDSSANDHTHFPRAHVGGSSRAWLRSMSRCLGNGRISFQKDHDWRRQLALQIAAASGYGGPRIEAAGRPGENFRPSGQLRQDGRSALHGARGPAWPPRAAAAPGAHDQLAVTHIRVAARGPAIKEGVDRAGIVAVLARSRLPAF